MIPGIVYSWSWTIRLDELETYQFFAILSNSILRIYVPSTLNVVAQHTEVLIEPLDLTPDISKQPTPHDQVHYSLRIKSSCK